MVRIADTGGDVLAGGLALARRIGKTAVVVGAAPGFVGNAIGDGYRRICEFMVEEGAAPEAVDAASKAFEFVMGPFWVGELT